VENNNNGKIIFESGGREKTINKNPVGRPPKETQYTSPNISVFAMNPKAEPEALKTELVTHGQIRQDENTLIWGLDDALPLHILNAIAESPTATNCIGKIETYTKGSGFTDPGLMELVINEDGQTLWDLHAAICQYYCSLDGFAVNFKYNLKGKIIQAYNMALDSCRLAAMPETNVIHCLKYNPYFGTKEYQQQFTSDYPLFNPKNVSREKDIKDYKGQGYFFGTKRTLYKHYPVPKFWAGKKWIYSDAKFATYVDKLLDNGFFESVLMKVIGDPNKPSQHPLAMKEVTGEDGVKRKESYKTEGQIFNEMMAANFSGVEKAGKVMAMWALNKDQSVSLEAFPTNVNPDLISGTLMETIRMIAISSDVPAILANLPNSLSSLASGGDAVQSAVEYMQAGTEPRRNTLENFYNNILLPNLEGGSKAKVKIKQFNAFTTQVTMEDKFWQTLTPDQQKTFVKNNIPGISDLPETVELKKETISPETLQAQAALRGSVGGVTGILSIQQGVVAKTTTRESALSILTIVYGFSITEAYQLLGVPANEQGVPIPPNTDAPPSAPPEESKEEVLINDNLKNMTGRQQQQFLRIIKQFSQGKLTAEQAKVMLRSGFGLTEEEISQILTLE
jgi:hypothetical protein